jgi:hypothetical protein
MLSEIQPAETPMKDLSSYELYQMLGDNTPKGISGVPSEGIVKDKTTWYKDPKNLRYAPIAFDALAAAGLFGKAPKPVQYNPTTITQQGYLSPQQMDEQSMRNTVDSAYGTGVNSLRDASGGSGALLRANLAGLNNDYMSGIGKAYSGVNAANMAQKQQADQYNLGTQTQIAGQNAQMINQGEMYNNQLTNQNRNLNWDTRMSYLGKGAEGLGDVGYETRNAEIMPRIYGYNQYGQYRPLENKNAKACGGRLKMLNRKK